VGDDTWDPLVSDNNVCACYGEHRGLERGVW
jgi:hypothetical protein